MDIPAPTVSSVGPPGRESLLALLRCAAEGERTVEEARCRLCDLPEFDPFDAFKCIQWSCYDQRGSISTEDLCKWLELQPHSLATLPKDQIRECIAKIIAPHCSCEGEMRYDGFLSLVLPRSPELVTLKEDALLRGTRSPRIEAYMQQRTHRSLSVEVVYRFCDVLECEKQLLARSRVHIDSLSTGHGVKWAELCKFIDTKQGMCAGMGGFISPGSIKWLVVDQLGTMGSDLCQNLLRRINHSGKPLLAFDEVMTALGVPSTSTFSTGMKSPDLNPQSMVPDPTLASPDGRNNGKNANYISEPISRQSWNSFLGAPEYNTRPLYDFAEPFMMDIVNEPNSTNVSDATARQWKSPGGRLTEPAGPRCLDSPKSPLTTSTATPSVASVGGAHIGSSFKDLSTGQFDLEMPVPAACKTPTVGDRAGAFATTPDSWVPGRGRSGGLASTRGIGRRPHSSPRVSFSQDSCNYPGREFGGYTGSVRSRPNFQYQSPARRSSSAERRAESLPRSPVRTPSREPWKNGSIPDPLKGSTQYRGKPFVWEDTLRQNRNAAANALYRSVASPNARKASRSPSRFSAAPPPPPELAAGSLAAAARAVHGNTPPGSPVARQTSVPQSSVSCSTSVSVPFVPYHVSISSATEPARRARLVMQVLARQGRFGAQMEDANQVLPPDCTPESIFTTLDRHRKGYISEADLVLFAQEFETSPRLPAVSYGGLRSLAQEAQLRRCVDPKSAPGHIQFRDLATILLPAGSEDYASVTGSPNDNEARSVLYMLRTSEPCPQCGMRVQRDAEAAGCPNVTCPVCMTLFRCQCVVGDRHKARGAGTADDAPLSRTGKIQLIRFLSLTSRVAEDIELDRRGLAVRPADCDMAGLRDAFHVITNGRTSMVAADLHVAFTILGVHLTEREFSILWSRYAAPRPPDGRHSEFVGFIDFARQLRPPSSP